MVDTFALLMLVLALLLAPKDAKEITLDAVDPSSAKVQTLTATRTADGFTVTAAGENNTVTIKKHAEKNGFWTVSMSSGDQPVDVEVGPTLAALEGATGDDRSATAGDKVITASKRGDIEYLMAAGTSTAFVRHPAKSGSTLKGKLKHRKNTGVMNAENYRYGEFVLETEGGRVVTLVPTAAVTKDALAKLDGKKVEVSASERKPAGHDPREAAPMDGNKPMDRAPTFDVKAIKALD